MHTLAARMADTNGRASGFDYLRLFLALSILLIHTAMICHGLAADQAIYVGPARPLARLILPAFFAISGFLVAGSLERSRTIPMFLALRVLRIYPGLIALAAISAFVIGPLTSDLSASAYFSNHLLFHYLLTMSGDVQFYLPGVFAHNPQPGTVNGQLWTIPFELGAYLTLAGLATLGLTRWNFIAPLSTVLLILAYLGVTLLRHHLTVVFVPGSLNGALLMAAALTGASLYLYRRVIPYNLTLFAAALVISMLLVSIVPFGDFFAPIPAAYATVYLGLCNPDRRPLHGADYSYGVYLYGFSLQQTIIFLCPLAQDWRLNMLISVPAVLIVAALSWHFIENPAQNLRHPLRRLETLWLSRGARAPERAGSDRMAGMAVGPRGAVYRNTEI